MGKVGAKGDARARLSFSQLLDDLDKQWPSMKFLGFGAYYAWIFLCYNSDVLFDRANTTMGSDPLLAMYLASTTALGIVLIVAGVFHRTAGRIVESRLLVVSMAGVATLSTLLVSWSVPLGPQSLPYIAGCALTGVGTAFVALRLGSVYRTVDARQAFMYTAGSFIFAGMLYFVCIGIPQPAGLLLTASLPLVAVAFTMAAARGHAEPVEDVVPMSELPRGYFMRLVVAVSVFSVIAGVIKGFMVLQQPPSAVVEQGVIIVFATGCVAVLLFVFVGLLVREFDISQLYYPIIILTCLGNLVVPLFGGLGVIQNELVSIAYNLFILMVWCLLANVANRTDLSYTRVFGWGRGASAAGTTVGWFTGSSLAPMLAENPNNMVALAMGMVFVLLMVSMVILNERTIGSALKKTRNARTNQATGDFFPNDMTRDGAPGGGVAPGDGAPREGTWTKSCNALAEQAGLSMRERDVLFLLGKGRTIEFIANDLGISFNTAKSHIRNVYTKVGVHSKQELQSLIDERRDAS
ncbi:helix-turn-helix transcriptional regulator [Eggerthella sinensis]|uniref:helix-turn-helix transcriptional regulator n=1 Tax=Eggerthella sinensis TaxID=242230 RepID=UPI00266CAF9E|nr:helix-turn-helix transcriptional regulator [Eggerthella sinensis]